MNEALFILKKDLAKFLDQVKRTDPPAILVDDVIITSSSRDRRACRYKMADDQLCA